MLVDGYTEIKILKLFGQYFYAKMTAYMVSSHYFQYFKGKLFLVGRGDLMCLDFTKDVIKKAIVSITTNVVLELLS